MAVVASLDTRTLLKEKINSKEITQYDVEIFLKENEDFSRQFVLNYLQTNSDFSDDYISSNASMELFQKWYDNNVNLKLKRNMKRIVRSPFNRSINEDGLHEPALFNEEIKLNDLPYNISYEVDKFPYKENDELYKDINNNHIRRYSEPIKSESVNLNNMSQNNSFDKLDTISEAATVRVLRKSHTVPRTKYRTISLDNGDMREDIQPKNDPNFNLEINTKPFLRKAQSAPIDKANLSYLIRSSVYNGIPSRNINVQNMVDCKDSNEATVLMEIYKDISKDLSLNCCCFNILMNFGFLLNVEKASLYIVNKNTGELQQQFNAVVIEDGVRRGSVSQEKNILTNIPFGMGIIGHVAASKTCFCSDNVTKSEQYEGKYDTWYNDNIENVLVHSIPDNNGNTIGVIVGINNKSGSFTEEDKQICKTLLSFCGTSLTNAQIFELTKQEFDRNKALLELSHDVFQEQSNLSKVIQNILNSATEMFKCKSSSLMLIDDPKEQDEQRVFSQLFQVTSADKKEEKRFSKFQRDSMVFSSNFDPFVECLSDSVALTSRNNKRSILNSTPISSVKSGIYKDEGTICTPVRNNIAQIIGVVKLTERVNNLPLTASEQQLLEAFSIFAGLGINNCIMYDKIVKGQAHQKVALEALSYHTAARQVNVDKVKFSAIPTCSTFNLTSLTFDDFSLLDNEMLTASIRMFMEFGFLKKYQIEHEVLCRFLITVKNNYRRVIYHNWRHAFNVTQSMFAVLTAGKMSEQLSSSECLALLVGCLCHDLDHRGTNNEFQMKTDSPLAKLYGTSTMEHHHFNRAIMILNSEGNNIFSHLQSEEYRKVMKLIKHAILATDLSNYFRQRETFSKAVKTGSFDTNKRENRAMLRSMLMTACDLNGITKPWEIQKRVVHLVTSEFFHQGDIERDKLHVEPKQMMDRKYILQLPKLQVQFFETMGIPVYKVLAEFNSHLKPLVDGAMSNKSRWLEMSQQIEQGHVDPDIEPVLHPVKNEDGIFYL